MAIDAIGGNEQIASMQDQVRKLYQAAAPQPQPGLNVQQNDEPVSVSIQRSSTTMGRLDSFNQQKNLMARNIRATSDALATISEVVGGMKENLGKIIKNYPPFPPDSSERKEILMSYASLRKEILSMTFPPPPAPLYEKNATPWEKLGYTEKGSIASSVPEISSTATDSEVGAAAKILAELVSAVSSAQKELVGFVTD
ncbi:MAG: hypothetical protein EG828_01270 [Deltaproteobacteria bacterium]|nr:hypothetical protein [Deltaproteobacteria bacterium]